MFNITPKYFSIFNNKPPASWVAHKTRPNKTSFWSLMSTFKYCPLILVFCGKTENKSIQFVIIKALSYFFEDTIGFDVKVSFASRPVSCLVRWYSKPGDKTKEIWEKSIQFYGTFHGLKITNYINKTQKRTLQLIYDTKDATFEDLLRRGKSRTIHEDTLHKLLVEIYKSIH